MREYVLSGWTPSQPILEAYAEVRVRNHWWAPVVTVVEFSDFVDASRPADTTANWHEVYVEDSRDRADRPDYSLVLERHTVDSAHRTSWPAIDPSGPRFALGGWPWVRYVSPEVETLVNHLHR